LAVADVNGDGRPDVIASNQASGDVSVLLNDGAHSFSQSLRFRASTGISLASSQALQSQSRSVSVVAGDFLGTGGNDLVRVNAGDHALEVLASNGGGFDEPRRSLTTSTSDATVNHLPGAAVAGDFNRDGKLDLAVLMQDTGVVWVYTNNGN